MTESSNVELAKRGYAAFMSGDIPGLLELCTADIDFIYPSIAGVPYATGARRGLEAFRQFIDELAAAEETEAFPQDQFIAQGDSVVMLGTYRARARSTGRVWESAIAQVMTVRDAKIKKMETFFDTAASAEAYRS